MDVVVCGTGPMGTAVADGLRRADHVVRVLGRPASDRHAPSAFGGADVTLDFSIGPAVAPNVAAALEGGCRRFVIGTTAWEGSAATVEAALRSWDAAAVVAPTFSPGVTLLASVVEQLAASLGRIGGYDPYVVEWHRAGKRDRPSGTARELARRLLRGDPRKRRIGEGGDGPADTDALEVHGIRAGAAPGTHLVGWDAPGETVELRVTARGRDAYVAGAIAAAEWLMAATRAPGFHAFASVLDATAAPITAPTTPPLERSFS